MTLGFFAKLLVPEVQISIYKKTKCLTVINAGDIGTSDYAQREVHDWTMSPFGAYAKVEIKEAN